MAGTIATWQLDGRRRRTALDWSPSRAREIDAGLHVRRLGTSGPVLLLLHGLTASGRFWGDSCDTLAAGSCVVIPDLLGFGRSPKPESGYRADDHVDALLDCLERFGLSDAPLVIGAHSLGTLIALRLAVRRGPQVHSIVAFSPPLYADWNAAVAAMRRLGPMARLSAIHQGAAHATCNWVCAHRRAAAAIAVTLAPALPRALTIDSVAHTWASFSETLEVIFGAEGSDWLDHSDVSFHLIAGGLDPIIDRTYLTELTTTHRNVTLDVWPDAGHLLPLGHGAAMKALLDDRLRQVT